MVVSPASELIIRTGSVTLLVKKADIVTAFGQVSHDVEALGGFVASSRTIGAGDAGGAELVLRVPSSSFSTLVTDVDSVGKVQDLAVGGQDVTGQSIDLQAQITNLKSEETALRNLLSSAGSIPNLLQVQDQLFGVQGEVQQLTAQEGSLLDRATFATLSVHLTPRAVAVAHHPTPRQGALARAFQLAVHNTVVAFKAVVTAIGWAFPLLIVGGVVAFVVMWRRRRPQGNSPTPAET